MNGPRINVHITSRRTTPKTEPGNEAYQMAFLSLINGAQIYVASAISNPSGVANSSERNFFSPFVASMSY